MRTRVGLFEFTTAMFAGNGLPDPPVTPDNPEGEPYSREAVREKLMVLIDGDASTRVAAAVAELSTVERIVRERTTAVIRVLPREASSFSFPSHYIPRTSAVHVPHTADCVICKHLGAPTQRVPPRTSPPFTGPLEPELREVLRGGDVRAYLTGLRPAAKPRRDTPRYMLPLLAAKPAPGWRRVPPLESGFYHPQKQAYGALARYGRWRA